MYRYILFIFLIGLFSCSKEMPLITNPERLEDIKQMLEEQKQLTSNGTVDVWKIFDEKLTTDERQALEFLYAYMPLSDLADYPPEFFLANVRMSLKARKEMPWGDSIPEEDFLHFVLPVRINNENLDSFRIVMYDELKARVQGMDIESAVLEINHWCNEKVVYRGTDERTSAPLSAMRKAFGRCGEESTFTVSALRAVGIPARQVYTPRWAHSDDNHAWVEIWINGTWKFMGACEPNPQLNMGWFRKPAQRTLLVHTRAYGKYFGREDVVTQEKRFSELNLTSYYAPVKPVVVQVKDKDGKLVPGAKVEFQLYNYAEYYPIATRFCDDKGETSVSMGLGEIIVWANKGEEFAFKKISITSTDTVRLTLGHPDLDEETFTYDLVPPHLLKDNFHVSDEEKELNNLQCKADDKIRNAYTATFKDTAWSVNLATELGLPEKEVVRAIQQSYGNWPEIEAYFRENAIQKRVLDLLKGISDKDYSDTKASILTSHLLNTKEDTSYPEDIFVDYILAPRIRNEMLREWRPELQQYFAEQKEVFKKDPQLLTKWIKENIRIDDAANKHSRSPLSPVGVYKLRVSDTNSSYFFFVAVCRALGIPARLNPATLEPEYYSGETWYRAGFQEDQPATPKTGSLVLKNGNNTIIPQYYIHFTIGQFHEGKYRTLEYDFAKKVTTFTEPLELEAGDYDLVTGTRLGDGTVLSSVYYFKIEAGKTKSLTVTLRQSSQKPEPIGKLDFSKLNVHTLPAKTSENLQKLIEGQNLVIALLNPEEEPSKHVLDDLIGYVEYFKTWPGKFVFVAAEDRTQLAKVLDSYALPENQIRGYDENGALLKMLTDLFGSDVKENLPLVLLSDSKGDIYLFSSGYKIGIGEQMLKLFPVLSN